MARHNIDLVDLDGARKLHRSDPGDETIAQARCHFVHVVLVQLKFARDLQIGKIEAHEVKAQNPQAQGLMMAGQDRAAQVIEASPTAFAPVALAVRLRIVPTVATDALAGATGAAHRIGPTMLTNELVTLAIVDESGEIDQLRRSQNDTSR